MTKDMHRELHEPASGIVAVMLAEFALPVHPELDHFLDEEVRLGSLVDGDSGQLLIIVGEDMGVSGAHELILDTMV